ncbi:MAG: hypothetical protein LBT92_02400 [Rickettsiales bacterium]|jgi:hypothetical protein|nr:hypothetical protein [Rickettsiales bacterium]
MINGEERWRDRIAELGLPEMPLKASTRARNYDLAESRRELLMLADKFLQYTFYADFETLAAAGFPFEAAMQMKSGTLPQNIDIMLKTPVEYGGEITISNMFVIKKYPFRDIIATFLSEQTAHGAEVLFTPDPSGRVFLPALRGFASAGGNTTDDRMTAAGASMSMGAEQAAAQAAAARAAAEKKGNSLG